MHASRSVARNTSDRDKAKVDSKGLLSLLRACESGLMRLFLIHGALFQAVVDRLGTQPVGDQGGYIGSDHHSRDVLERVGHFDHQAAPVSGARTVDANKPAMHTNKHCGGLTGLMQDMGKQY